jgi:cyclase
MVKVRLIAVIIVADGRVVQSVRFKHTNAIHADALHAIECFNKWSIDEIVLVNASRHESSRAAFADTVERVSSHCFVPLATGGWITDIAHGAELIARGADKLVVNTAVFDDPALVTALAARFGNQCVVASMDVRRIDGAPPQVVVDRGTRPTGVGPVDWATRAIALGAGEIFFNSIDHDGARKGYDLESIAAVARAVDVPVIAMGGVFSWDHLVEGVRAGADAVAAANIFHYTEHATKKAKRKMAAAGLPVRNEGQ